MKKWKPSHILFISLIIISIIVLIPTIFIIVMSPSKPSLEETARNLKGETDLDTIFNIKNSEKQKGWKVQYLPSPQNLSDAWNDRIGDCTDRSNIIIKMLNVTGIDAYPVRGFSVCTPYGKNCCGEGRKTEIFANQAWCRHDWVRINISNPEINGYINIDLIYNGSRFYCDIGIWDATKQYGEDDERCKIIGIATSPE